MASADVVLRGHDAEGYGLAWRPLKAGWLLSRSYDKNFSLLVVERLFWMHNRCLR
jgi:histone-binding protein RBBP4